MKGITIRAHTVAKDKTGDKAAVSHVNNIE